MFHADAGEQLFDAVVALGFRHLGVTLERERDVLCDGERVVQRGVLKQKAHLDPEQIHSIETEASNLLPMNGNRTGIRSFEPDDDLQEDALAHAAAAEDGERLTKIYAQIDSVQDVLLAKRFVEVPNHQDWLAGNFGERRAREIGRGV